MYLVAVLENFANCKTIITKSRAKNPFDIMETKCTYTVEVRMSVSSSGKNVID